MGELLRDGYSGIDAGNIDRGTPGWMRNPTTGTNDTAGMPLPTPRVPQPGESEGQYMDYLHGLGYGVDDIFGLMGGGRGFERDTGTGEWGWDGWGTGPVVRGQDGYQFANAAGGGAGGRDGGGGSGIDASSIWGQLFAR